MFDINNIRESLFPHAKKDLEDLYEILLRSNSSFQLKLIDPSICCYKDGVLVYQVSSMTRKGYFVIGESNGHGQIKPKSEIIKILTQ
jgi:hypothetical protein